MARVDPKEIPECGYFLIVLKHEGNMPFENDGLRGGVKEATVNYIIYRGVATEATYY